ncbi:MAG TPA: UDP-glucose/GDP-mannose dehydrogenase family protein [Candidatus Angelobacter sp.]
MQISVIGSGYVGLVAATCLTELGHKVICVDSDLAKIAALNAGEPLIHEDYLQELLSRHRGTRLSFSSDLQDAARKSAVIFIAVGTPSAENGAVDLSCVEAVVQSLAGAMNGYKVIVEKSTVPVYTSERVQNALSSQGHTRADFDVVSNPEFLREGTAVTDFLYPDRIVVGANNERASGIMREIYAPLIDGSYAQMASAVPKPESARPVPMYIETSPRSAELIKHASNAFLALKISFINSVASFCESVGATIEEVSKGIGSDSRIGPEFLRAGIGYGGSCFPKDVAAFRAVTHEFGFEFPLLDEIKRINDEQRVRFIGKVRSALRTIKGKRLAVLGLAFKDGTDDVRESPAIKVIEQLLKEKCHITAFDPAAMERARQILGSRIDYASDPYAAADGADALLILTEWKEFASLDLVRIKHVLRSPIVLDGRNVFSQAEMAEAGLSYHSIGRPALVASGSLLKKGQSAR